MLVLSRVEASASADKADQLYGIPVLHYGFIPKGVPDGIPVDLRDDRTRVLTESVNNLPETLGIRQVFGLSVEGDYHSQDILEHFIRECK